MKHRTILMRCLYRIETMNRYGGVKDEGMRP